MKRLILTATFLPFLMLGMPGCAEKSTSKSEKTVSTPGGTTKVTEEVEVKKTGNNPP